MQTLFSGSVHHKRGKDVWLENISLYRTHSHSYLFFAALATAREHLRCLPIDASSLVTEKLSDLTQIAVLKCTGM